MGQKSRQADTLQGTFNPRRANLRILYAEQVQEIPPPAITSKMIKSALAPRILVIDDDPDQCTLIAEQLQSGFPSSRIESALDTATAFGRLTAEFDLIVLDYNLPDRRGDLVLEEIKSRFPAVPVLVLTAGSSTPIAEHLLKLGAHDFIIKGHHTRERLHVATVRAMEARRLLRQNKTLRARNKRQGAQIDVVNQASRHLSSILDPRTHLLSIVQTLCGDLGYRQARVILLSEFTGAIDLAVEAGIGLEAHILEGLLPEDIPHFEEVLQEQKSRIARDKGSGTVRAIIPINKDRHVLGMLVITQERADAFDSSDIRMLEALSQQIALSVLNSRLFSEIQRRVLDLNELQKASQNIGSSLDLEAICLAVYRGAAALVETDYFWIVQKGGDRIPPRTLYAHSGGNHPDWLPPDAEMLLREIQRGREGVILSGDCSSLEIRPLQSCLVVPMRSNGDITGFIAVGSDQPLAYGIADMQTLTTLANQSASALKNACLYARVQHFQSEMVNTLVEVVEAKSEYTIGHSNRVRVISLNLGLGLGLSLHDLETLERSAYLHDLGKISIPDAILDKPSALSHAEYELIKTHPVRGQRILMQTPSLANLVPVVRHHHERWDGRGYPDGLAGSSIPLLARIVAVADAFDAMTSARPYRPPFPLENVLTELKQNAGKQHDSAIIALLIELIDRNQLEDPSPILSSRAASAISRAVSPIGLEHASIK